MDAVGQRRKARLPDPVPDPVRRALEMNLLGVALSGGGIRSATFNLGVLQGLSQRKLLREIDYLSTVSGGGYIGAWFHGVVKHRCVGKADEAERLLDDGHAPGPANEDPITWLRKYSNYLAPRLGLFSKDVWVLTAIWLRNVLLNQCVLLPAIAAVLLLPVLLVLIRTPADTTLLRWLGGGGALSVAVTGIGLRLREVARRELKKPERPAWRWLDAGMCALLVSLFAVLAGGIWTNPLPSSLTAFHIVAFLFLFVLYGALMELGWFRECYADQKKTSEMPADVNKHLLIGGLLLFLFALICACLTTGLLAGAFHLIKGYYNLEVLAWGPPLVAASLMTGVIFLIGLMGADYPDSCREWLSRTGALIAMMMVGWCALFAFGVFAPDWVAHAFDAHWPSASAAAGTWLLTTLGGVLAGNSSRTRSPKASETSTPLELLTKVAPTVFLVGYLILISMGCHAALRALSGLHDGGNIRGKVDPGERVRWVAAIRDNHYRVLIEAWPDNDPDPVLVVLGAIAILGGVSLILGSRVNINEFSIHHLYKNRIVRCYLGASKRRRRPNAWTGFDPQDDVKITDLVPQERYFGPYPIVNTAVNLNSGSELATQDRKAASFFLAPLYSGFVPKQSEATHADDGNGFVPTKLLTPDGPALGTATAISGAAANPNMGYHTSGPMAFLLTVFNVRLGWWLGNPVRGEYWTKRTGPAHALPYLCAELLGMTKADSNYVNLSDGGHFDNLGLYELVRRRCRFIIVGDGEQDAGYTFGSLAGTIRRCRADFGVDIDLDFDRIRETSGRSAVHAVVGKVHYREKDGQGFRETGTILYIKASVTGDEPEDIREFRARCPDFPHQSTGDQFFDESQFESYRQLGLHVVQSIFENIDQRLTGPALFAELGRRWYPPPAAATGAATRHAEAYSSLMNRLATDADLQFLDPAFCIGNGSTRGATEAADRRGRIFCIECIQLMENVYTDLQFDQKKQFCNPVYGGWRTVFVHWANQPQFQEAWKQVGHTYNPMFRQFFDSLTDPNLCDTRRS